MSGRIEPGDIPAGCGGQRDGWAVRHHISPRCAFSRTEWVIVAIAATAIVVVNKVVIHDRGNDWFSLVFLAIWIPIAALMFQRWWLLRRLRRPRRRQASAP